MRTDVLEVGLAKSLTHLRYLMRGNLNKLCEAFVLSSLNIIASNQGTAC